VIELAAFQTGRLRTTCRHAVAVDGLASDMAFGSRWFRLRRLVEPGLPATDGTGSSALSEIPRSRYHVGC